MGRRRRERAGERLRPAAPRPSSTPVTGGRGPAPRATEGRGRTPRAPPGAAAVLRAPPGRRTVASRLEQEEEGGAASAAMAERDCGRGGRSWCRHGRAGVGGGAVDAAAAEPKEGGGAAGATMAEREEGAELPALPWPSGRRGTERAPPWPSGLVGGGGAGEGRRRRWHRPVEGGGGVRPPPRRRRRGRTPVAAAQAELAVGGRRGRRPMGPRVRRGEWIRRKRGKKGEKKKIRGEKGKKKKLTEKYKKGQFRQFTTSPQLVELFCQTFSKTTSTPHKKPLH